MILTQNMRKPENSTPAWLNSLSLSMILWAAIYWAQHITDEKVNSQWTITLSLYHQSLSSHLSLYHLACLWWGRREGDLIAAYTDIIWDVSYGRQGPKANRHI